MTQFNLNIPAEKVQQFLTQMAQIGFRKNIEQLQFNAIKESKVNRLVKNKPAGNKHPYYDQEFYNAEI